MRAELPDLNKYVLYGIKDGKKYKVNSGIFNDSTDVVVEIYCYNEFKLCVYPKYLSKFRYIMLWMVLGFIELIATSFGSFGNETKLYKVFCIEVPKETSNVELVFNRPRFDLVSNVNECKITEFVKGKFYSVIFSIMGLIIFIGIIFLYVIMFNKIKSR